MAGLQARRVLVVEDETTAGRLIEEILWSAGAATVGPAATLAEALALLAATAPHAAVLDLALAGEVAAPVAEALLAHGVPFVIVTSCADHSVLAAHPRVPVLREPFAPEVLVRLLAHQLAPTGTLGA